MENLELEGMYRELGIGEEVLRFGAGIEEELRERFAGIDAVAEYNQMKVIGTATAFDTIKQSAGAYQQYKMSTFEAEMKKEYANKKDYYNLMFGKTE